jgi:hypothetical protein
MQVRELITRLGFDADTHQANKYDKALASVRRTAMVATTAVAALGAAATTLMSSFVQSSTETLSWARRLGIATDELQRLQFAASRYNVTNDALIDGLKEASLRADEFIKTGAGGGSEAFERLGLSGEELNRVSGDTAQLFELIQRRIQEIDNVAARQRIADEIFGGQAGEQFTEFLAAGRDETERMGRLAEAMGAIVPERSLERARALGQEFNTLKAAFKGIGASVASELLPVFRDIVDTTLEWLAANRKWITSGFVRSLSWLRAVLSGVWEMISGAAGAVDSFVEKTLGWETALKAIKAIFSTLIAWKISLWIWGIVTAIHGAVTAVGLLRGALILLQRVGILMILTAVAFALEDIYNWIRGGDSLIGKWIGSWTDFRDKVKEVTSDIIDYLQPVIKFLNSFNQILYGVFTLDAGRIIQGLTDMGNQMISWAKGLSVQLRDALLSNLPDWLVSGMGTAAGWAKNAFSFLGKSEGMDPAPRDFMEQARQTSSRRVEVNARTEATLQVPFGTTEQQKTAMEAQVQTIFDRHWDRQIRKALFDYQAVE